MTLILAALTQLIHIALVAAAAPTLIGVCSWIDDRLAGRAGPSPLQPWHELIRLLRKETLLADGASGLTTSAPIVCAACAAVAVSLVPSFALGMAFAPLADLLLIVGLLMAMRVSLSLLAMDAGAASGGVAASRTMLLALLAEPALLLVLFALALLAGSLNVDVVAAMQIENGIRWQAGVGFALAATMLTALIEARRWDALTLDLGGRELALVELADALRLLFWFDLIGALFVPYGMAQLDAGPLAWLLGIVTWLVRTLTLAAVWRLSHAMLGRPRSARAANILGVAALLGLLAAVIVAAGLTTA